MFRSHVGAKTPLFALAFLLAACTPELNWREVHASDGAYSVLMPAKPAAHTRQLQLGSIEAGMTLRGAEAGGVSYVIGFATLATPEQAQEAMQAMQTGMLRNIGAQQPPTQTAMIDRLPITSLTARGKTPSGQPLTLHARFATRGKRAYQAIVLGPSAKVSNEAAQTFLESFRPEPS